MRLSLEFDLKKPDGKLEIDNLKDEGDKRFVRGYEDSGYKLYWRKEKKSTVIIDFSL